MVRAADGCFCLPKAIVCSKVCRGVAKTLAVRSFATVVGGEFARIQFLLTWFRRDIVGTRIYRSSQEEVRRRAQADLREFPAR